MMREDDSSRAMSASGYGFARLVDSPCPVGLLEIFFPITEGNMADDRDVSI